MKSLQVKSARTELLNFFKVGISAVNGHRCVKRYLTENPILSGKIGLLAIGKAAQSMCLGALDVLGSRIQRGLLITRQGHVSEAIDKRIVVMESDHPIPSQRSLDAGQALTDFLKLGEPDEFLLLLISGGTSALVELLPERFSPQQLKELNAWLLSKPWSIEQINCIRKSISLLKGGRGLTYCQATTGLQLSISDVESNAVNVIGSGPFVKNSGSAECDIPVPQWIEMMQQDVARWDVEHDSVKRVSLDQVIVADNAQAREAIRQHLLKQNLPLVINEPLYGEINTARDHIVKSLINGPYGVYIWGGETVVDLPEQVGKGGRCQALALSVAEEIDRLQLPAVFLACGTDGTDGAGDVAGALVDPFTIQRGRSLELDAELELMRANAGHYLEQTGDLIDTGLTGTNVMDLMIAIKLESLTESFDIISA